MKVVSVSVSAPFTSELPTEILVDQVMKHTGYKMNGSDMVEFDRSTSGIFKLIFKR